MGGGVVGVDDIHVKIIERCTASQTVLAYGVKLDTITADRVGVTVGDERVARTHVVLSDEVMSGIDRLVGERGRSRFLEQAAREKLARLELEQALIDSRGILDADEYPDWRDQESTARWVARYPGRPGLSSYILDTTVLIAHLRGDQAISSGLLLLLRAGNRLCTTCVNIAEVERGLRQQERKTAENLLSKLAFLNTTREAARRAGEYQAQWISKGVTIHTPDALIAGTARSHGAIVVLDNASHFPMPDVTVTTPAELFRGSI